MTIIREDFIGAYVKSGGCIGRPDEDTKYTVGMKVKSHHIASTATIAVGNERWSATGVAHDYEGLSKALKKKELTQEQWQRYIRFASLQGMFNLQQYAKWTKDLPHLVEGKVSEYVELLREIRVIVYKMKGWKLP